MDAIQLRRGGPTFELPPGPDWRAAAFFVGVPLAVALYASLNNWMVVGAVGYGGALVFYAAHALLPWWTTCAVTAALMRLLQRWRPPQTVLLGLGTLVACGLTLPYCMWLTETFAGRFGLVESLPGGPVGEAIERSAFWPYAARASAVWFAVNLVFDRVLGFPRYRYAAPEQDAAALTRPTAAAAAAGAQPDDAGPRFLARLPVEVRPEEVIALKAEQHYLQVWTAQRSFMTLYRFGDAVAESEAQEGLQVHRSHWVRLDAIRSVRRGSRRLEVELDNGLRVPVSGPHRAQVLDAARRAGRPVRPV